MKRRLDGTVLYGVSDLAGALGEPYSSVWARIYARGVWPAPEVQVGRRSFYAADKFAELVETIRQHRIQATVA